LKATLEKEFQGVEVELVKSSGGAFEVSVGGRKIFSKLDLGRFPDHSEIVEKLR
jgi:selT/selW/selH-like putative selenoprotein